MTKLSDEEKCEHRAWFESWHDRSEMQQRARELMNYMGAVDLFNQSGVKFITEAFAAAQAAALIGAEAVRLVAHRDEWPDFQLRLGAKTESWEFTEADLSDRRRGDEYEEEAKRIAEGGRPVTDDPVEDWVARADQIPTALSTAIKKKLGRRYGERVRLLIYLNINEYGIQEDQIEAAMESAAVLSPRFGFCGTECSIRYGRVANLAKANFITLVLTPQRKPMTKVVAAKRVASEAHHPRSRNMAW